MNYYAIVAYKPILANVVNELESLGLIVPFDSQDAKGNIYAYCTESNPKKINSRVKQLIGDYFVIRNPISEEEVLRHKNKSLVDNELKVGDLAFINEFGTLPFRVVSITNNKANLSASLKSKPLNISRPLNQCKKVSKDSLPFPEFSIKPIYYNDLLDPIYVDCDILKSNTLISYYNDLLKLIIATKIYYPENKIILLNPLVTEGDLIQVLRIPYIIGLALNDNLKPLISNTAILSHTNNFNYESGIISSSYHNKENVIKHFLKLDKASSSYIRDLIIRANAGEDKSVITFNNVYSRFQDLVNKYLDKMDYEIIKDINEPVDVEKLHKVLVDIGASGITAKADEIAQLICDKL